MTHNATFCPECGREMTRVKMNRLIGRDGWRWYCPVCAPEPHAHTPIVPWCVQCGQPMRPDGQQYGWVCEPCCWRCTHDGQWSHDTARLATRMFANEHPARTGTGVKAYVAGFTAAWNLCHADGTTTPMGRGRS